MLIKRPYAYLPVIVHEVGNPGCRQNVERKILSLAPKNLRLTINPSQTESARNVRNEPAAWSDKVVTHPQIDAEITVFYSAKNRFRNRAHIELVVAAQPRVALHNSPSNARGEEFGANLVIDGRINCAKQIA